MGFRGARAKLRPFDIIIIVKAWICLFVFQKAIFTKKSGNGKKKEKQTSLFSPSISLVHFCI